MAENSRMRALAESWKVDVLCHQLKKDPSAVDPGEQLGLIPCTNPDQLELIAWSVVRRGLLARHVQGQCDGLMISARCLGLRVAASMAYICWLCSWTRHMDSKSDILLKNWRNWLILSLWIFISKLYFFLKQLFWGTVDVQYKFQIYNIVIHNF